jgi:uncharacterized protein YjiS (DUF1127 family)
MQLKPRALAMTCLRSVPPDVDNLFQLPRSSVRVQPLGFIARVLRRWRRVLETRRARTHLVQLDDRLLRDFGLSRIDVFGDFEELGRRRGEGGV